MEPSTVVVSLSLTALVLLCLAMVSQVIAIWRNSRSTGRPHRAKVSTLVMVGAGVLMAMLFLRPHEHAFSGLDVSAYRLMAQAFRNGQPMKGVDESLHALPRELRDSVLYRPAFHKTTRDQSFRIDSMESCATRPFFYPLLPLAMRGSDLIVPRSADYLVPFAGLVMALSIIYIGVNRAGLVGLVFAFALLLGSPFPAWFLRGCYPESIGSVLIVLSLLAWVTSTPERRHSSLTVFALGLSVSFHPVLICLALPSWGIVTLGHEEKGHRSTICDAIAFGAGLLPLYFMTRYVTAPYGALDIPSLLAGAAASTPMLVTLVAVAAFGASMLLMVAFRTRIQTLIQRVWQNYPILSRGMLAAVWILPTLASILFWGHGEQVRLGLVELEGGLRWPLSIVLGAAALTALVSPKAGRTRLALTVVFLTLPVFLYLKGWDNVGLWSQRRLLPPVLIACALSLVPLIQWANPSCRDHRIHSFKRILLVGALGFVSMANLARWPAPYLVRQEYGADQWVKTMRSHFQGKTVFFDYHPYSVPFSVGGHDMVFGLGPHALGSIDMLSEWIARRATREEVWWITAYDNPGTEDGVRLEPIGESTIDLPRVQAKAALPALRKDKRVHVTLLRAVPADSDDLPTTDRILNGGVLGLRGPWGRADLRLANPAGDLVPVTWSRDGSSVLGPIPPEGTSVRITIEGSANRIDGRSEQTLYVQPPWDGRALELKLTNGWTVASGLLDGPPPPLPANTTGPYSLTSAYPYDPGAVGVNGYAPDLGALIHRVRIEAIQTEPSR